MEIVEDAPLAPLTTIRLGGSARYLAKCHTPGDILAALEFAGAKGLPVHILSGGSNTIFPDGDYPGVVVQVRLKGIQSRIAGNFAYVAAQAGENWDDFVAYCVSRNWTGIESLSGIPGSVGATPVQNVGAYGQSVSDTVSEVFAINLATHAAVKFPNSECRFGYRTSIFKENPGRFIITSVTFRLVPDGKPGIKYPELAAALGNGPAPTAADVRSAVLQIRAQKGMAASQVRDLSSCGSFFTNPVISVHEFDQLQARAGEPVPSYPEPDGRVKVPAAWLIEHAGFTKGERRGGVGISPHHILALVNYSGTATELVQFAHTITSAVRDRFGIMLEPEPVVIHPK